jgi:ribA/ribD-fused uncharacterized protein
MQFKGEYAFLSNFYPSPIQVPVNGDLWPFPTVENAYQATKSRDPYHWVIIGRMTPAHAKRAGRKILLRPNWDKLKLPIMEELVRLKFLDPKLRLMLNATGDIDIIEHNTWGDTYWGVYRDRGYNHLGEILMRVRAQNRAQISGES